MDGLQGVCSRQASPLLRAPAKEEMRLFIANKSQIGTWLKIPHSAFLAAMVKVNLIFRVQRTH